jgi:hypothetical protein
MQHDEKCPVNAAELEIRIFNIIASDTTFAFDGS